MKIICQNKAVELIPSVYEFPTHCPECNSEASQIELDASEGFGVTVICNNHDGCPGQIRARLIHFCKKSSMDMEDIGPELIAEMTRHGIRTPDQLYALTLSALLTYQGVAGLKAANTLQAIAKSKERGMDGLLCGLGIPRLGETLARKLSQRFASIWTLSYEAIAPTGKLDFMGPVTKGAAQTWFRDSSNIQLLKRLAEHGVDMKSKSFNPDDSSGSMVGQTVVFTGTLVTMERPYAQKLVEQNGGRATGSVSKKTTLVVVGDQPGSKLDKARTLGIKVVDEQEFIQLLGLEK